MHYISRIEHPIEKEFIDQGCQAFFERLTWLNSHHNFFDYVSRFTENSFTNLYIQGLIKTFGLHEYNYFTELGITTDKNPKGDIKSWGRVDLVVEQIKTHRLFIIESKNFWSNPNEPESKHWEPEITSKFYNEVLAQARNYVRSEPFLSNSPHSFVGLTFSRVEFDRKNNEHIALHDKWNYSKVESNEFYGFETYKLEDKILGVSVYGIAGGQELALVQKSSL